MFFRMLTIGGSIKNIAIGIGNALFASILGLFIFLLIGTVFFTISVGGESFILLMLFVILPLSLLFFGGSAYYFTASFFLQGQDKKAKWYHLWFSIGIGYFTSMFLIAVLHFVIRDWGFDSAIAYWNNNRPWFLHSLNDIFIDGDTLKGEIEIALFFLTYLFLANKSWRTYQR